MTELETKRGANGGIKVPYMNAYGVITKTLERVIEASTPDRFTQDFLATKLGQKGGSAKPVIPFLKRTGFLNGDGTPTELYKRFRNPALRPAAAAQAVKIGYAALYEVNEYVHDLKDGELKGVVVQATGLEANSSTVKAIIGSFAALKKLANFEVVMDESGSDSTEEESAPATPSERASKPKAAVDIKLGYTINLNLPATSDIAVFNAIFKSLRDHLLDQ